MKRKWWLWLLLASACSMVIFGISELTGISLGGIFGLGIGSVLLVVALIIGIPFALTMTFGFAYIVAQIFRLLLSSFISNREMPYITFGILGLCTILVGFILTATKSDWSLFVIMVGFFMGCLAGAEYQRFGDLQKE